MAFWGSEVVEGEKEMKEKMKIHKLKLKENEGKYEGMNEGKKGEKKI